MIRLVHRRSAAAVLVAAWRSPAAAGLLVRPPPHSLLSCPRSIATGVMSEKKNITFTPKDVSPDLHGGQPAVASHDSSAITEIDLTQFIVTEPSAVASAAAEVVEKIGPLTATDIGLTWWCPTGGMFKIFELMHEMLPWWGTIAVSTLIARILVSPFVVYSQRNTAKMSQNMPILQEAQAKFQKARRIGNQADIMKASMDMQEAMAKTNNSVTAAMIPMLVQAPLFMSFFLTLRAMTGYPVEKMAEEGLFWFKDLTLADPYYALPIFTSATLFMVIKMGVEYGNGASPPGLGPQIAGVEVKKIFQYAVPAIVLFCTRDFAAGILVYWCTTNMVSLGQVLILNQPSVRKYLNIPELKRQQPGDGPVKKKRSLTESWEEFRLSNQVEDRSRILSEQAFAQAATGPLRKTYRTDPTKAKTE